MDLAAIQRRLEIEQLYTAYAHCLDDDRLEEWPDFFTEDCAYRVTSAENFEAGLPLGIIYATSKNMLIDRVIGAAPGQHLRAAALPPFDLMH
jgi:anthranilate 1,2-dioxygenase small subunit